MTATNENGIFAGKVAFVTGAGSGMGRTTALAFAREGASVVLADVSDEGNQDTARMIEELGGRALAVRCDVTRSEDVQAALNQAVDALGRFDVAFNNAGASRQRRRLDAQRLPDQCRLPRDRRHGDDAAVHSRHHRGPGQSDRAGTHRTDGNTRRNRRRRPVAVF